MTELEREIAHLQELQAKHRQNIRTLEEMLANYGMDRPLKLVNELEFEREQLRQVERRLEELKKGPDEEWVYCHPANYAGRVWIRLLTNPESAWISHRFVVRWGPWELEKTIDLKGHQTVSLVHAKAAERVSVPIRFSITPACYVSFGQGKPPKDDYIIDINRGWILTNATE